MDPTTIFDSRTSDADAPMAGTSQGGMTLKRVEIAQATSGDDNAAFEAFVCRAIERDLDLPPGSIAVWEPDR